MKVRLLQRKNDPTIDRYEVVTIGHLESDADGRILFLGLTPEDAAFFTHYPVFMPDGMLTVEDGEAWLRELPHALSLTSMIAAEVVSE